MIHSFREIVNINELESLLAAFSKATGYPVCLIDKKDDEHLIEAGWRVICAQFHKVNEPSKRACLKAAKANARSIPKNGEPEIRSCDNGLIGGCVPIVIEGQHVANLCTGQILFTAPDLSRFSQQAKRMGFNEDEYMKALLEVPVVSEQSFRRVLTFLGMLGTAIGKIGLSNLSCERNRIDLNNQKSLLDSLIDSIPDVLFYKDHEGRYIGCNKAFERYSGLKKHTVIGKNDFDLFPVSTAKTFTESDKSILTTMAPLRTETVFEKADGKEILLDTVKTPYISPQGELLGLIGICRDITEQRKAQNKRMTQKKLESIGILAGGIAHDFNNALTSILGNIDLATEYAEKNSELALLLKDALTSTFRAKELTGQLITFAKGGEPVRTVVPIDEIVERSAKFALSGSPCALNFSSGDNLRACDIDETQISQVIQNIVLNSRQSMATGGTVTIVCENLTDSHVPLISKQQKCYVKITISDSGTGIPEKSVENIFDPYFSTKESGNGLGLSICHSIISRHNGSIEVESTGPHGTTLSIVLPAASNHHRTQTTPAGTSRKKIPIKILLMDDEPMITGIARRILEKSGYEVTETRSGEEAIQAYEESLLNGGAYDLVIMDLTIVGGMGGQQAVSKILQIDPNAKVVVSSGYSSDPVMAACTDYGFVAAIEKPFKMKTLKETVKEVLST